MAKTNNIKYLSPDLHVSYVQLLFHKVVSKYADDPIVVSTLFTDVFKRYTAKDRHYHNIRHIYRMCKLWLKYKNKMSDPDAVFFAIIYHDIIYNPKKKNNEEASAMFFHKLATKKSFKSELSFLTKVRSLIVATKHGDKLSVLMSDSKDCAFLLDFDLEILGTEHLDVYDWYKSGVRKEYKMYSNKIYNNGRKSFLEAFLKKEKIYLTKEFKRREKRAKINLHNEIKSYI